MSHDTLTALTTAAAAVLGAIGKGMWDWLRSRIATTATVETARIGDGAQIRAELWAECDRLRDRLDAMERDLDKSRRDYLALLAEHSTLRAEYLALKHEHEALLIRYGEIERRVSAPPS